MLLVGDGLRAEATTVLEDLLGVPEEGWMTMEMYFAVSRFVPFCVKEEISLEENTFNLEISALFSQEHYLH